MNKLYQQFLLGIISVAFLSGPGAGAATINPNSYPAADEKELGQLRWVLKLADQDIADFSNFQSVDEQGISASRYSIAFSAYFLAAEQYHKFPAWRETIQPAFDRINRKMIERKVWDYWARESLGITKFEPVAQNSELIVSMVAVCQDPCATGWPPGWL